MFQEHGFHEKFDQMANASVKPLSAGEDTASMNKSIRKIFNEGRTAAMQILVRKVDGVSFHKLLWYNNFK